MKKTANRKGANLQFYKYATKELFATIDYANSVAVELSANRVYATGGDSGARQVGFDDPIEGTIKIDTQIVPIELVALACSPDGVTTGASIANREKITVTTAGEIELKETPVAGTIYVYKASEDMVGEPVATTATAKKVTITGAQKGDVYIAYYIFESETAQTVTFSNDKTPGCYTVYGDTVWKDTNDNIIAEHFKAFKVMPKKAFSITYQGTGDPLSLSFEAELMEAEDGKVYETVRI